MVYQPVTIRHRYKNSTGAWRVLDLSKYILHVEPAVDFSHMCGFFNHLWIVFDAIGVSCHSWLITHSTYALRLWMVYVCFSLILSRSQQARSTAHSSWLSRFAAFYTQPRRSVFVCAFFVQLPCMFLRSCFCFFHPIFIQTVWARHKTIRGIRPMTSHTYPMFLIPLI